jgi:perosamine synthetase
VKRIEFGGLRLSENSKKYVNQAMDSNWISQGPFVERFEQAWRELFEYPYTRAVSSGTSANMACCLALLELGAKPGDEVICPAISFIASFTSIIAAGLVPKPVDVDWDMNILPYLIEQAITPKTKAIMAVNLMGVPCQLDIIQDIAYKHNLYLIIDNCEAYGSTYKDKFSLHYGDFETTSSYSAHICQMGEGGTVSTKDPHLDKLIQSVRSHGRPPGSNVFTHDRFGLNFKQTDLHAAVGLGQLEEFWSNFQARKIVFTYLRKGMERWEDKFHLTTEPYDCVNAPHGLSMTFKRRETVFGTFKPEGCINRLAETFEKANIATKKNFGAITQHKALRGRYRTSMNDHKEFCTAEWFADHGLHIGCHRCMTEEDCNRILQAVEDYFKGK